MARLTTAHLRRHAVTRSLFRPTTLARAIARLGFVQADPIRAPARAQDLILRHRVRDLAAGDLEARYPRMALEEDYLVNYGFLPRDVAAVLHPRGTRREWTDEDRAHAAELAEVVRRRRVVLPREVAGDLASRTVVNAWGGRSNAVTALLDQMHYRGMLRVHGRVGGHRRFAPSRHHPHGLSEDARADALVDLVVGLYAPLPARTLTRLVSMLRWGAPGLAASGALAAAAARARERLGQGDAGGVRWFWPADEDPTARRRVDPEAVRLLAPFDPVVWDRDRFEILWGWPYRFEAYTPVSKRVYGYYALPVLADDDVVGWANLTGQGGRDLVAGWRPGFRPDPLRDAALAAEHARLVAFAAPRPGS